MKEKKQVEDPGKGDKKAKANEPVTPDMPIAEIDQPAAVHYSFPTVVRCPRCRGVQTRARSTQGERQYRVCMAPICQWRFMVRGTPVVDESITKTAKRKKDIEDDKRETKARDAEL